MIFLRVFQILLIDISQKQLENSIRNADINFPICNRSFRGVWGANKDQEPLYILFETHRMTLSKRSCIISGKAEILIYQIFNPRVRGAPGVEMIW